MARRVFVADHCFPPTFLKLIRLPGLEVVPLHERHPDLVRDHEDWQVMRELKARGGVDGWVTIDASMLNLQKEMVVLHQTRLTLVVFQGVDNDPIVAQGLMMIHLPQVAKQTSGRRGELWVLRKPPTTVSKPWNRIVDSEARRHYDQGALRSREAFVYGDPPAPSAH